jgi:hypothetical protein
MGRTTARKKLNYGDYARIPADAARLECYRAEAAGFRLVLEAGGDSRVTHPDWAGLIVDLPALWR